MAYYFLFPETDTTIYSHPDRDILNTGQDEILEIVKERGTTNNFYYPSRALLKFKNDDIKEVIGNIINHDKFSGTNVKLQLTAAEPRNIIQTLNLDFFAVSQSWDEGTGRYSNMPSSSNGASWVYRQNTTTGNFWFSAGTEISFIRFDERAINGAGILTSSLQGVLPGLEAFTSSFYMADSGSNLYTLYYTSSVIGTNPSHFDIPTTDISGTLVPIDISGSHSAPHSASAAELAEITAFHIGGKGPLSASYTASFSQDGTDAYLVQIDSLQSQSFEPNITTRHRYLTADVPGWFGNLNLIQVTSSAAPARDGFGGGFAAGSTGSLNTNKFGDFPPDVGGGNWYTGSNYRSTQQFLVGDTLDIDADVTSIVRKWSSSLFNSLTFPNGIENNGFLIKQPDVIEEETTASFGELQYFSVDTHTIYPPKLVFKWDDSTFDDQYTSSIINNNESLQLTLYNNKEEYNQNDVAKFKIHVRDKYPTRQFASSSNYLNAKYLPTSSHYSIRDAYTEQEVIPFDDTCTKLSADSDGMFFQLYMKGLQPERYYRVLFRSKISDSDTVIHDNDYYFKVVR